MAFIRGNVYFADLGAGEKRWLVVSNNGRNNALGSALAVRITTTPKPPLRSIVRLGGGESVAGSVLCDDITVIYDDDPHRHAGALSPAAMAGVARALGVALGL
ncbi:MAG: type II toxin-antitoxin system PemK/MazF family toxin [Bifidobacteriaceae bacterium]|jgi:mRNA interferase MazF|nr:type II toxin-antitoxin system PemK/MazF family toxin [Bifidobacteriaceae bacterium]